MPVPIKFTNEDEAATFFGVRDKIQKGFFAEPFLCDQSLRVKIPEEVPPQPSKVYKVPEGIWIAEINQITPGSKYRWYFCIYQWLINKFASKVYEPLEDLRQLLGKLDDYADGFAVWAYDIIYSGDPIRKELMEISSYATAKNIEIAAMCDRPVKKSQFTENEYYTKSSWKPICRDILCFSQAPNKSFLNMVVLRNGIILPVEVQEKRRYIIFREI